MEVGIFIWLFAFFVSWIYFFWLSPAVALFRATAWTLGIAIIATLNINWLLDQPVSSGILGIITLFCTGILFLLARKRFLREGNVWRRRRAQGLDFVPLIVFILAFLAGGQYFGFRLDEPRYSTPDPGTHYLYMSQTAKTGIMPLFDESRIYPATGFIESWKEHHKTYFPGSTAIFFVFDQISPLSTIVTFQLFNIFFYALLCGYFFALSMRMFPSEGRYFSLILFSFILLFGVFFEFIVASFTTQLLGLLFLLFFADTYHQYYRNKVSAWLPIFAFASILITYIYWLPVALFFILFERLSDFWTREVSWKNTFFWVISCAWIPLVSLVLSLGYILIAYETRILGYSSADGGFPMQKEILRDVVLVIPFALFAFYSLIKRWWRERRSILMLSLFLSASVFSFTLISLYNMGIRVSHYTAFKSLYLLLPLVWVFALLPISRAFSFLGRVLREKEIVWDLVQFRRRIILFAGLYLLTFAFTTIAGIHWKIIPLHKKNITFSEGGGNIGKNITSEQIQMLDAISREYASILQEGRVLVIAPPDTALWIFAYSGIWPRTYSLLGQSEQHPRAGTSPMDMYSPGIADYETWFKNDPKRILVYFQTKESKKWMEKQKFPQEEYDILYSVGENKIYSWKESNKEY